MNLVPGIVTKSTGSWYAVRTAEGKIVECRLMGQFRIKGLNTKNTNPIAVGDHVKVEVADDGTGCIVDLEERKNYIIRRSANLSKQTHILAANLDHAYVLATLHSPRTSLGFIDRFLVTAEAYGIPASVIFNKRDLMDEDEMDYLGQLMILYASLGYMCSVISANERTDVEILKMQLKGKVNLICGHSGSGKSTLINALDEKLHLRTGEISKTHSKGMHTTTFAEMMDIGENTFVIDTPGIKELGIVDIEKNELSHFFPEMRTRLGECKYNGCLHDKEPGCAVRAAVENSQIALTRYECYLQILNGEELQKEYD
ncbi:MAG TPA: ribosome small subunit-dependent GTPase A [Bacteroidia bacterium]|jgi:ribosome biogenesis GTPase|nr:ribosome small subunit-dependent GTPase A [Bacteroidia bacterium]